MTIDEKTLKTEMKALEILKVCRERGQKRAGGISLEEAIAELEALQHRSCESCKYCHGLSKQSFCILNLMPVHMYEFEFCCNKHEAKEQ